MEPTWPKLHDDTDGYLVCSVVVAGCVEECEEGLDVPRSPRPSIAQVLPCTYPFKVWACGRVIRGRQRGERGAWQQQHKQAQAQACVAWTAQGATAAAGATPGALRLRTPQCQTRPSSELAAWATWNLRASQPASPLISTYLESHACGPAWAYFLPPVFIASFIHASPTGATPAQAFCRPGSTSVLPARPPSRPPSRLRARLPPP